MIISFSVIKLIKMIIIIKQQWKIFLDEKIIGKSSIDLIELKLFDLKEKEIDKIDLISSFI